MRIKALPALIALTLAGAALQAHATDDRLYIAPSLNYTMPDNGRNANNDWGAGLALGKPIAQHLNLELSLTGSNLGFKTGPGDYKLTGLGVDALYLLNRDADFTPYGVLGAGVMHTEIPGASDSGLMANVGVGIMKRLTDNVSLRADARYRWDGNATNAYTANNFGDFVASVGLNIALGQKPEPKPVAQPEPMPVAQPAPEPAPAPAPEPKPEPVAQPEPAPVLTTKQAAQLEQAHSGDVVTILEGVNFEFDSARLRPDAVVILDEAVLVLKHRKDMDVDIVGHTDSIGTKQYNQGLSVRRAKSVYDFFVSKGIAADRLTTQGFGETKPIASNKTRAGRAKNRRVELHVK